MSAGDWRPRAQAPARGAGTGLRGLRSGAGTGSGPGKQTEGSEDDGGPPDRHGGGLFSDRRSLLTAAAAVLAIALAWVLGGASLGGHSSSRPAAMAPAPHVRPSAGALTHARQPYAVLTALVRGRRIGVYRSPRALHPFTILHSPNLDGAPLVFLVQSTAERRAHVLLPIRPNGSTGWVKLSRVSLAHTSYHVVIYLTQHKLTVRWRRRLVLRTPVGVGRAVTPTPAGRYYITELLKQPDPNGLYGPYAFGLSAHSNVLHEFAGRDGILGIHGTNYPRGIGTNVSHGCIRVSNAVIRRLAHLLPLGTPVLIVRRS